MCVDRGDKVGSGGKEEGKPSGRKNTLGEVRDVGGRVGEEGGGGGKGWALIHTSALSPLTPGWVKGQEGVVRGG